MLARCSICICIPFGCFQGFYGIIFAGNAVVKEKRIWNPFIQWGFASLAFILISAFLFPIPRASFFYSLILSQTYHFEMSSVADSFPISFQFRFYHYFIYLAFALVSSIPYMRRSVREKDPYTWIYFGSFLVFSTLAWMYSRLFIYSCVVLLPLVCQGFERILQYLKHRATAGPCSCFIDCYFGVP